MNSSSSDIVYLDNAATSWPKPPGVSVAMSEFLADTGANPGRSGHRLSIQAGVIVDEARCLVADLFKQADPLRVVFTHNATHGLNAILAGSLRPGDTCLTTVMEHNSIRRPLALLKRSGVNVEYVNVDEQGVIDLKHLEKKLDQKPALVATHHASNVLGTIQDLDKICALSAEAGAKVVIDAAQTAGHADIDVNMVGLSFVVFTGHKSLLGPTGTGGVIISPDVDIDSIDHYMVGGTGSKSDSDEHPEFLPERFEAGTVNTVGIAGLTAGIRYINERGLCDIRSHEQQLCDKLLTGLGQIDKVTVYGCKDALMQVPVVSFTINGMMSSVCGQMLDEEFEIMTRVGLHCAPGAHKVAGTHRQGTVRASIGPFTTEEDVDRLLVAVESISKVG